MECPRCKNRNGLMETGRKRIFNWNSAIIAMIIILVAVPIAFPLGLLFGLSRKERISYRCSCGYSFSKSY